MQDSTKMLTCKRWSWRRWGPSHQEPERTCGRSRSAGPPCPGGRLRGTAAALAEGLVQWCPLVPILVWNKQSVAQQQAMKNVAQNSLTGQWQLTLTAQQQAMANVAQDSLTGQWQLTLTAQQQAMTNVAQNNLTGQWQLTPTAQQQAMTNFVQDRLQASDTKGSHQQPSNKQWQQLYLTPSLPQSVKFPGWKVHTYTHANSTYKYIYIWRSYNKSTFNTVHFATSPVRCSCAEGKRPL